MKQYLDLVKNILDNGIPKQPTRMENGKAVKVENGTIGLPCQTFLHDMRTGFPALTTRKIAFKSTMIELEGFINGITDKKWYEDRGCKFWSYWANPVAVENEIRDRSGYEGDADLLTDKDFEKQIKEQVTDLGPVYGYQWRKFGSEYNYENNSYPIDFGVTDYPNGLPCWQDQLQSILDKLKTNPYDRRMVCSAWNPNQEYIMALPPCHFAWNIMVYGNTISLQWTQRSCDLMCGVSHNIASYAMLLILLAKHANLEPWLLKGDLNDCHIYENQIEEAKEQLKREPRRLPLVQFERQESEFDIFKWTHKDVKLIDYDPHPPIKFKVTV